MSAGDIHSARVILLEGDADLLVRNAKAVAGMRGFMIMVPHGDDHEWFLDLLWRMTMVYAGKPSWLKSRAKMSRMVEAVMCKESRKPKPASHPALESGLATRPQRNRQARSGERGTIWQRARGKNQNQDPK